MNIVGYEFTSYRRIGLLLRRSVVCNSRRRELINGTGFTTVALFLLLGLLGCATEEKDWNQACSSNSRDSYQIFLQRHPSNKYSAEAVHRIEEFDWNAAQKADNAQAYEVYLRQYPKGAHVTVAEARLDIVRKPDVTGSWKFGAAISDGGMGAIYARYDLVLRQTGSSITGTMTHSGPVKGSIDGPKITLTTIEPSMGGPVVYEGYLVDAYTIDGTVSAPRGRSGSWSAKRQDHPRAK